MPEIVIKHVISCSSEDKIHKAENILTLETYRKWKCATPGEKKAILKVQFEKSTKIHSIDIGNECSAFVEVLVGRSSDASSDYQVLLVASSFMTPIESRNETHTNRVRMFGPENLSKTIRDEKWDCAQIVCTQPFNKNITYGLTFIKFSSPAEISKESTPDSSKKSDMKIGAFRLKSEDDDDSPSIGTWFKNRNTPPESGELASPSAIKEASSFAASVLAANSSSFSPKSSPSPGSTPKRKYYFTDTNEPPAKKEPTQLVKVEDQLLGKEMPKVKQSPKTPVMLKPKPINKPSPRTLNDMITTPKRKEEKRPKQKPLNKLMEKVIFVLSGFVNPLRSELRDKAVEMGAKYKGDWDNTCTHLICAFLNTPKYTQVQKKNGKIVNKEWILDCYKKKELLNWKTYKLGRYSRKSSDETDSDSEVEVINDTRKTSAVKINKSPVKERIMNSGTKQNKSPVKEQVKNGISKVNGNSTSQRSLFSTENVKNLDSGSETEDEDALKDYIADTDVESSSGGDTEDEIRKVERGNYKIPRKASPSPVKKNSPVKVQPKPDTSNLPLPELPNFFKNKIFYLYGDFSTEVYHDLQRYITAYNGILENYMSDNVKYVITESEWDHNFDEALSENEDLIFVKPQWIFKCDEMGKFVPYQPFIIIPNT